VNAQLTVIDLKLGELSLEIARIQEQNVVQILSAAYAYEQPYERVRKRCVRYGLDFFDVDDAQVRLPSVILEKRTIVGTQIARQSLASDDLVEHPA